MNERSPSKRVAGAHEQTAGQTRRKAGGKAVWLVICLAALGVAAGVVFLFRIGSVRSAVVEAGTPLSVELFVKRPGSDTALLTDVSAVDMTVPGEYEVQVRHRGATRTVTLTVQDTVPPTAAGKTVEVPYGAALAAADCVEDILDATQVRAGWEQPPDLNVLDRPQSAVVRLTDAGGNRSDVAVQVTVKDLTAPVIQGAANIEAYVDESVDYMAGGVTAADDTDPAPTLEIDSSGVDMSVPGVYTATYTAADASGNVGSVDIAVTVKVRDVTAPVIRGARDLTAFLGDSIVYRDGVTVTDDMDPTPMLEIDSSGVDINVPGVYTVTYTAVDASGNAGSVDIAVTMREKPADYVDEETVYATARKDYDSIITDGMTDIQKALAIYYWVRGRISYRGYSAHDYWTIGAYQAFTQRKGDCYVYYAAAKAMLNMAGIRNIDVVKSDTSHSSHYWLLIDLGYGWYHFDACPRWDGGNFFMLTDEELINYSQKHNNSHVFDGSLYPERAVRSVQKWVDYQNRTVSEPDFAATDG